MAGYEALPACCLRCQAGPAAPGGAQAERTPLLARGAVLPRARPQFGSGVPAAGLGSSPDEPSGTP